MRTLEHIDGFSDIYQPVSLDDIEFVQSRFRFTFPASYTQFLRQPDMEAIKRLPSLLWFVHHRSVGILEANDRLRKCEFMYLPYRLIAFATNECGDYFCFNRETNRIAYVDPDCEFEENLKGGRLVYDSFDKWLEHYFSRME